MKRLGNEHQLPSLGRRRGGAPFLRFGVTERCEDARLETLPVRLVNPECRKLWKHFDRHHSCLAKTLVKACVGAAFLGHIAARNFHLGFELGAQRCIDKRGHVFRSYHDAYPPAGSSHARHLGKHAPGITLFHHSASDARVEAVVGKGQILSASLTKFYGFRQTFFARKYASLVQEIAIDIQSRDRIRCFGALSQKALNTPEPQPISRTVSPGLNFNSAKKHSSIFRYPADRPPAPSWRTPPNSAPPRMIVQ